MPQNLGPQTTLNAGNQIATETNQKPRTQPKSFNRRLNSKFGGSRSSTKMHKATIHDSTNKFEPKHLRIKGTTRARKTDENSSEKTQKTNELQTGNRRNHESFHSLEVRFFTNGVKI
jgi:hypothetical protein